MNKVSVLLVQSYNHIEIHRNFLRRYHGFPSAAIYVRDRSGHQNSRDDSAMNDKNVRGGRKDLEFAMLKFQYIAKVQITTT